MKFALISLSSFVVGFSCIYAGFLAFDYISFKNELSNVELATPHQRIETTQTLVEVPPTINGTSSTDESLSTSETASTSPLLAIEVATASTSEIESPVIKQATVQKAKETLLKVPLYFQELRNSCEAASIRMALAFKNINVGSDMELIQKFGYNPVKKDTENNIWSDPQKEFVGFADERCSECGYGVYGIPVVKTVRSYGLEAIYLTDVIPSVLSEELSQNNPVVFWGYTSVSEPYTWKTPMGSTVKAFKGTHTRVLTGFRGDKENPTGFYVNDPLSGKKNEYWSTSKLVAHMNAVPGVTNQMVVVK